MLFFYVILTWIRYFGSKINLLNIKLDVCNECGNEGRSSTWIRCIIELCNGVKMMMMMVGDNDENDDVCVEQIKQSPSNTSELRFQWRSRLTNHYWSEWGNSVSLLGMVILTLIILPLSVVFCNQAKLWPAKT